MTNTITYQNVSKHFGNIVAVDDISLTVEEGELLALLGPSGSGKTTTLRMLAGFENPTDGRILLDGEDVTQLPTHKRNTGMVFQDYALFPHMTVAENIAFGLKRKGYPEDKVHERIEEVLRMIDLAGFGDRQPDSLSGGQQQRVATARAIAIEPKVLLMDEPLGALDKKLRDQLEVELVELQNELGITTLYVTHNQEEALTMADRVAVMNDGHIEQIATPNEIYEQPATTFVADFIGDTNFLDGNLVQHDGYAALELDGNERTIVINDQTVPDEESSVFVRPEKISLVAPSPDGERMDGSDDNVLSGTVDRVLFLGSKIRYYVTASNPETQLVVEVENRHASDQFESGDQVQLVWDRSDTHIAVE